MTPPPPLLGIQHQIILEPSSDLSAEQIEARAWRWFANHQDLSIEGELVPRSDAFVTQSGIAPASLPFGDGLVTEGAWWIAVAIVSPDLLARVEGGALFTPVFPDPPSPGSAS